jgi:hypothetical protein
MILNYIYKLCTRHDIPYTAIKMRYEKPAYEISITRISTVSIVIKIK